MRAPSSALLVEVHFVGNPYWDHRLAQIVELDDPGMLGLTRVEVHGAPVRVSPLSAGPFVAHVGTKHCKPLTEAAREALAIAEEGAC